jgi:hypothetical protein
MEQTGPVSPVLYTAISPVPTEATSSESPVKHEDGSLQEPPKKKQKRNKPTLSCQECVERKTKVSQLTIDNFKLSLHLRKRGWGAVIEFLCF